MNTMRRIHGKNYDFHPDGFILPGEKDAFLKQVNNEKNLTKARTHANENADGSIMNARAQRPATASSSSSISKSTNIISKTSISTKISNKALDKISNEQSHKTSKAHIALPIPSYLWITKPVASSCGRGISVITGQQAITNLSKKKKVIMQKYIDNPYLIDEKKFDLRICKYIFVTYFYMRSCF